MKTKYELTKLEEMAYQEGYQIIAGVDEAGRGPLAGPVVAAACIFPRGLVLEGVDDSKKISPIKREEIYQILVSHPEIDFAIGVVEQAQIDVINILQASLAAMAIAVKNLIVEPDFLLVDGNQLPPTRIPSKAVVKGDSLSQSIAAASILAKHSRDQMMLQLHLKWPQYGFDKHKGYATRAHLQAIQKHGPCPIHRKSFEPIKSILAK
ncbi:ribonuclease HII [Simkania negevensis]|uniref:Ribonuclease HII n=1 Tax=Simkania negevensis (strain ATCC VR-1471 / DSM 27360 / Z) TaxID=331113 RepID=F8L7B5_SIMNZ|nr:ribonuclease HII [Simkania negevensis]CCB88638.1 ribonuclease HII [Simkania negevensis Z]